MCVEKLEKIRTTTAFEPVTSRYWLPALTNGARKPLTLGTGHLRGSNFPVSNESMNKMIHEMNHILNCGYEIK